MIVRPKRGALAELTSLSRSGRLHRPLAGAGGLAALSVSCNPVKELLPLPLTGRSPKASAKVRNVDFNILSLNRGQGIAHTLYIIRTRE